MTLRVNGEAQEVPAGSTISDLLDLLGLNRDGVAVALNGQVIPRTRHSSTELPEGAAVEIIRAVGGG